MASTVNSNVNTTGDPLHPPVSLICAIEPMRWTLVSILAIMMLFAIFGNVVLITSIWRTPKLRTRMNCFIFNLACADLAVALVCMPFSLVTCYLQRWVFGHVLCQINGFMNILFGASSLLTLSAISLEKYFSIVRAMDHVITKRRTVYMLLVTWTVPAVFAVMPLTGFTSYRLNPGSTQCSTETPLRTPGQITHVVFMFLCSFFLPLCIIGASYVSIFGAARRHSRRMRRSVIRTSSESLNFISTQNQIALTVFIMIIVFLICWSPFFVYLMYLVTNRALDEDTRNLVLAGYWLAFLNSALNPYIYGVRNPQVRRVVRSLLSSLLSVCRRSVSSCETRRYGSETRTQCMPTFGARGDIDVPCGSTHSAIACMVLHKGKRTKEPEGKEKTRLQRTETSRKTSTFDHALPMASKTRRASSLVCITKSSVGLLTRQVSIPGYINMVALDEEESSKQVLRTLEMEQEKQQEGDEVLTENRPANCIGHNAEVYHSSCQLQDVAHGNRDSQSKGTDLEEVGQKIISNSGSLKRSSRIHHDNQQSGAEGTTWSNSTSSGTE